MAHPATTAETLAALESNARDITKFFSSQPDDALFTGDADHWGPAHHLVHLTQTCAAIERGLRSRALPRHSSGRSRSYAEVRDAATSSLGATSKERLLDMGRKVVIAPGVTRAQLVEAFLAASVSMRAAAVGWSEEDLDRQAMKHPLIGEMTAREMLLFCVVHERHHLKLVRKRLTAT